VTEAIEAPAGRNVSGHHYQLEPGPSAAPPAAPLIPAALSDAQCRAASSRLRAGRDLARARLRRRVAPPLVVGTVVLLGGGLGAAWVDRTLPVSTSPATGSGSAPAGQSAELRALDQVRQTLASDDLLVSTLSKAARHALAVSEKTTVIHEVLSGTSSGAAPSGAVASGAPGAASASGGTSSLGALPALPPLPPMPAISVPSTHGTTGASHVVP